MAGHKAPAFPKRVNKLSMVSQAFPVFLSETEAAQYLGLSVKTLRRWRFGRTGPIYAKLNSKLIRYAKSDLDDWISQQKVSFD